MNQASKMHKDYRRIIKTPSPKTGKKRGILVVGCDEVGVRIGLRLDQ